MKARYDEVAAFKQAAAQTHMKVILGTGDCHLRKKKRSARELGCIEVGEDLSKTATGRNLRTRLPGRVRDGPRIREYAQEATGMARYRAW